MVCEISMATMGVCRRQITICLTLVASLCSVKSDNVQMKNAEHDADEDEFGNVYGLPGVQFEYQFEVGAGRSQCFFQQLKQNSQLHFTFEVRI